MPQKSNIVATKTVKGDVCIFDLQKHPTLPENNDCSPDLRLVGHTAEGYGIAFNPQKEAIVLSGANDKKICLWDLNHMAENKCIEPFLSLEYQKGPIEDVCWNPFHADVFASVSTDRSFAIWDVRERATFQPIICTQAHTGEIYTVDFNPFQEQLFITGSEDKTVCLWDLRKPISPIHSFESHTDQVIKVEYSPHQQAVFASTGNDRRVLIWDISRIGMQLTPEELEDGPPELLFMHGGHRAKVNDFSWNAEEQQIIASVEDNNVIMIWQMADHLYEDDQNSQIN